MFIGDYSNHRVMVFDVNAITNGENAIHVLGQSSFTTATAATSQTGLRNPSGVAIDVGGTFYLLTDHLGSVVSVLYASGAVVGEQRYREASRRRSPQRSGGEAQRRGRPFGQPRMTPGITQTDRGYTGHQSLSAVGLVDFNARWVDASLGMFASPDTLIPNLFNPQALNRYAYVANNPPRYTDPTGHMFTEIGPGEGGDIPNPWSPAQMMSGETIRSELRLLATDEATFQEEMSMYVQQEFLNEWNPPFQGETYIDPFGQWRGCDTPECLEYYPENDRHHVSLDFPAPEGQGVFAVAQGTVVRTGYNPEGFGNYVVVEHDINGFPVYSVYAHLSEVLVGDDEFLEDQYRLIGTVGNTGGQASYHLHYEVRLPANISLGPPDDDPFRNHSYWALEHEGSLWTENFLDMGSVAGYYSDFSWAIEE